MFAAIFPPRLWLGQHSDRQTSSRLGSFVPKGIRVMRRVVEYKQHADDCRALAASTSQPDDKIILEKIATAWDKIAALRERDLEYVKNNLSDSTIPAAWRYSP